jgi:8-oxo-dGTP pyrophosphatase MutT (NUDIX family)
MDFLDFIKYVPKIEKEKLLAAEAHAIMSPIERIAALKGGSFNLEKARRAAVMMLLYPKNKITHLALIIRNSYPSVHASQIAFPGGKVEKEDRSLEETALRETHEEIGITPSQIQVIRQFSELYIPPSNFLVSPFLGISHSELTFKCQIDEVAGIIELSVSDFLKEEIVVMKQMNTSYGDDIAVPTFKVAEHHIWGATAMMMSELKEILKKVIEL